MSRIRLMMLAAAVHAALAFSPLLAPRPVTVRPNAILHHHPVMVALEPSEPGSAVLRLIGRKINAVLGDLQRCVNDEQCYLHEASELDEHIKTLIADASGTGGSAMKERFLSIKTQSELRSKAAERREEAESLREQLEQLENQFGRFEQQKASTDNLVRSAYLEQE